MNILDLSISLFKFNAAGIYPRSLCSIIRSLNPRSDQFILILDSFDRHDKRLENAIFDFIVKNSVEARTITTEHAVVTVFSRETDWLLFNLLINKSEDRKNNNQSTLHGFVGTYRELKESGAFYDY